MDYFNDVDSLQSNKGPSSITFTVVENFSLLVMELRGYSRTGKWKTSLFTQL